ncbi:MAG: hypothetical protein IT320_08425 [Anaerolineae bacterium]|nr:hypothetical protein [Anaerolineae bacterium]
MTVTQLPNEETDWASAVDSLVQRGVATWGPLVLSKAFARYVVEHYPLLPMGGIDWDRVDDGVQRPIDHAPAIEAATFMLATRVASFSRLAVVTGARQPPLILSFASLMRHIERVTVPRLTYCVGLLIDGDGERLALDHFIEHRRDSHILIGGFPR